MLQMETLQLNWQRDNASISTFGEANDIITNSTSILTSTFFTLPEMHTIADDWIISNGNVSMSSF